MENILIPIMDDELSPRFDLAPEVLIISITRETSAMGTLNERVISFETPSAEAMYRLVMAENIQTIICAGMENEVFEFLKRKGIKVIDNVCGPVDPILEAYLAGQLSPGQYYF
ncbi:NifB/NifX family molybdenum-iron cluster-binding protein [Pseudodesulfovibrio thermohalotolerans]|jgi:predicted Fe-Mo cluster-binding NifX family protein|uniref:NifB/NifX family molybdenum-iron cluster-binding protein n=1 Tax=Pseudodesulfovibrio thermohalotolerans TaxID=2880651 RepID=UPI002440F6E4|nr:NifB/NifX family molybdenum-iron cluster-binding protein [Pseudodesulfovibrio thermohalotolerans]WFS61413.1 NifB/NifX family molybdenum-iron cluster-binding protein [Pseudodesulfovibrio thermohalotolerans]